MIEKSDVKGCLVFLEGGHQTFVRGYKGYELASELDTEPGGEFLPLSGSAPTVWVRPDAVVMIAEVSK